MGLLRILLIAIAILICFLVILPKSTQEKILANSKIRFVAAICGMLVVTLSAAVYYWQDVVWKDQASIKLLTKRISVQEGSITKSLELSNYDLQNFSSSAILSILDQQSKIDTLVLKNISATHFAKLRNIFANSSTLKTLVIKSTATEVIMPMLALIEQTNFSSLVLRQGKLNTSVLEGLITLLSRNKQITSLSLEQSSLADNIMGEIVKLVNAPTKITTLSLIGNQFNLTSLTELAAALQKNDTLQILKISLGKPVEANKKIFLQTLGDVQLKVYFGN